MGSLFSKSNEDDDPKQKYRLRDGITLYDAGASPCGRRVRMTLLEKGRQWNTVEVDLLNAEQKTAEYLKINPNGKVPAIIVHNVDDIPDCCLFESNVITEFLDTVLPGNKLYPNDPWEKAQCQRWQEWEVSLTDDFVPFMYHNLFSFVIRATQPSSDSALRGKDCSQHLRDKYEKMYHGTYQSPIEMEQRAIACYENLLILEEEMEGKDFLVGEQFTIADLSVFPRVQMFDIMGLPITKQHFPNVSRYINKLAKRECFQKSVSLKTRILDLVIRYLSPLLVAIGNWRSGKRHQRFNGMTVINRVLSNRKSCTKEKITSIPATEKFVLYEYSTAAESLIMKILLKEKGDTSYTTVSCDFIDLIGRPNGSGGLFRLQHNDRLVTGIKTMLEYVNTVATGKSLYPSDPVLKAECQCWQAWDQTLNWIEFSILLETDMVSLKLHERFTEKNIEELLNLKSNMKYHAKFENIMALYMSRLSKTSPVWHILSAEFGHLIVSTENKMKMTAMYHDLMNTRLRFLESHLKNKMYLVGSDMTIADITVFCRLLFFPLASLPVRSEEYPNIASWMLRLRQREAFRGEVENFEKEMNKYIQF
ncbi:uncharacterized protein LOC100378977 [Saccoglossus kowalevskii]|uniref:Uncharacterized protein LOC100378977 n=1 Tax=Saccoglossus kowalevskii TaxID=10224 RepID=A0ABM0GV16_SACKO|nr:PREDICTED: uncharacterized protein LOC100378977 [Saccoglossus kowalevskii]